MSTGVKQQNRHAPVRLPMKPIQMRLRDSLDGVVALRRTADRFVHLPHPLLRGASDFAFVMDEIRLRRKWVESFEQTFRVELEAENGLPAEEGIRNFFFDLPDLPSDQAEQIVKRIETRVNDAWNTFHADLCAASDDMRHHPRRALRKPVTSDDPRWTEVVEVVAQAMAAFEEVVADIDRGLAILAIDLQASRTERWNAHFSQARALGPDPDGPSFG